MARPDYTKTNSDIAIGLKLGKALGLSKNDLPLAGQQLQRKDIANKVKEKIVSFLCKTIRRENQFDEINLGEEIHGRQINTDTIAYMKN